MTDYLFPPNARVSAEQVRVVSNSTAARSIFTGSVRTASRAGARLGFGISVGNGSEREDYSNPAALQSLIARLDGQAHRLLFADPGYQIRGDFPASELLTNNVFASGTAGWTQQGVSFSVTDRVARFTRTQFTTSVDVLSQSSAITGLTQYAPYVLRSFDVIGRGSWTSGVQLGSSIATNDYGLGTSSGGGMKTLMVVVPATSAHFGLVDFQASGGSAGDYYEAPYTSMSRCALVDGAVNLLLRSDEFDNASWIKTAATVTANAGAGADGTTTADALVDTGASTSHFVEQAVTVPSANDDFQLTVALKASAQSFACVELRTATGTANVFVNLSTGALSATAVSVSFSGARAVSRDMGGGLYRVSIVARKITSETSLTARIYSANSASSTVYAGASTAAILMWRATLSASGVAARARQTSTAGVVAESQVGTTLHLKGLPPSTNNLLRIGARVQVGTQMNIVTAPLHSDASGLGFLEVGFRWRASPADNAPVIIHQPFGRFVQTSNETGWDQQPGGLSNYDLQIEEALDG